jgi:hypothetical protein
VRRWPAGYRRAMPRTVLALLLVTVVLAGCGGGDTPATTRTATTGADRPVSASALKTAQAWFTAARLGHPAAKCALEARSYQAAVYGSAGPSCLTDGGNANANPDWAVTPQFLMMEELGDTATGVVQATASGDTDLTVQLVREDGRWKIASVQ